MLEWFNKFMIVYYFGVLFKKCCYRFCNQVSNILNKFTAMVVKSEKDLISFWVRGIGKLLAAEFFFELALTSFGVIIWP